MLKWSSLAVAILFVFLACLSIMYGWPNHPTIAGTFLILGAIACAYACELYFRTDMFEQARLGAGRLLLAVRSPLIWSAFAASGSMLAMTLIASYLHPMDLRSFFFIAGAVFVLTFAGSMAANRLKSGFWRISIR